MPDPDLPKLVHKELFEIAKLKEKLPELPVAKRLRYKNEYGIKDEDIETFINDPVLGQWFEEVASLLSADKEKIRLATNYCTTDLVGLLKNSKNAHRPKPAYYAELIGMLIENKISSRGAKDILAELVVADLSPMEIASTKDLLQKNDESYLHKT